MFWYLMFFCCITEWYVKPFIKLHLVEPILYAMNRFLCSVCVFLWYFFRVFLCSSLMNIYKVYKYKSSIRCNIIMALCIHIVQHFKIKDSIFLNDCIFHYYNLYRNCVQSMNKKWNDIIEWIENEVIRLLCEIGVKLSSVLLDIVDA